MTQPIATVNGKAVYSDKQIESIVNTRVNFADGSWCDVATGEVANRGSGYINIGAPASETGGEKTTFGPKTWRATSLDVKNVKADINIQPTDGLDMTVIIEGPKSCMEDINVFIRDNTLIIQGKSNGGAHIRGADVVISGGGGRISIGGGSVSIGGMRSGRIAAVHGTVVISHTGNEGGVKIIIGVPKGSAVKVSGVQGNVTIGDTDGSLHANVLGGDDIRVGKVRDATLSIQGNGNIYVDAVNGNLSMNIQGSGDIQVRGGSVNLLNANVMGSGDARFNGEAVDANLSIMGSGDIGVVSVKNRPNRNLMGNGDINIGNW